MQLNELPNSRGYYPHSKLCTVITWPLLYSGEYKLTLHTKITFDWGIPCTIPHMVAASVNCHATKGSPPAIAWQGIVLAASRPIKYFDGQLRRLSTSERRHWIFLKILSYIQGLEL